MAVIKVERLAKIRLNCRDPRALAQFFIRALGFARADPDGQDSICLALGSTCLDLAPIGREGRAYPPDVPGWSPLFQHFAMAVEDMDLAMARLEDVSGWRPISQGGPQTLPPSSGGVTAFKFRDPEGHPLELILFPKSDGLTPRVDHSAISVRDTGVSVAFYQNLGLAVGSTSLNHGPEQDQLDGMSGVRLEVTELLFPGAIGPHIELLCYEGDFPRAALSLAPDDVAATRLVLLGRSPEAGGGLRDPDGHFLELEANPN